MKFNKLLFLGASFFLVGCSSTSTVTKDVASGSHIFVDTDSLIKVKDNYVDASGNKGTLLYAYDSASSISFGSPYNGVFKASLECIANEYGSEDLKEYSILFTETNTNEQFAIKVINYSSYSYVAACYNGQLAGINYYESEWTIGQCYGFSGIANNEGRYTKIEGAKAELLFDPVSMKIQTKLSDNNYHDVWDFTNQVNDGSKLNAKLSSFDEYTISIVFDKISANGCGSLLVYEFCGYDLTSDNISTSPIINTHITNKAVVGKSYQIPTPTVTSVSEGELDSDDIKYDVYNSNGDKMIVSNQSFTPTSKTNYYIYYKYEKGDVSSYTFALIETLNSGETYSNFSEPYFDLYQGAGKIITIPDVTLETNLGVKASSYDCVVTIKRDGNVLNNCYKIKTGGEFTFDSYGTYEFIYSHDVTDQKITKTVSVDGRLAINIDTDKIYAVGEEFSAPVITAYKQNRLSSYTTNIFAPNGEEVLEDTFILEQEGIYTVKYQLDCENKPYTAKFTVKKKVASLFDDDDASYGEMTTNHSVQGVRLSLQNNETVTYQNVIDLNNFGFNTALEDPSANQEFIKLYIQPSTQNLADLEALYVVLTDVYDSSKSITIRMKYLSYFEGGCFIRAKANGQNAYVGYNYNFYTTERSTHNATSHEEGGFQSYCNFASYLTGDEFVDTGLPLYFDNSSLRLYSRPSWLTGHNYQAGDPYENINVPWLVYDFGSDNADLSGGNTPFSGFTTGEVYLSLYGKGISSSADIFVTSINGEELSSEYIEDTEAPEITIDESEFVSNGIETVAPTGLVGSDYQVFDFTAKDAKSDVASKYVTVYDPDNRLVTVTDNIFIPTKVGDYRLVFEASDLFGNTATKEVKVTVTNSCDPLSLTLDSDLPSSIDFGKTITLPKATFSGGSGNLKLNISVTANSKEIAVTNYKFVANEPSSTYVITYTVTDYLNQSKTITKNVTVNRSEEPVFNFNDIVLPSAFVNNDPYTFGNYVAYAYDANYTAKEVNAKITVKDANGEQTIGSDLKYTPKYSNDVTTSEVTISFANGSKSISYTYNIPIVKPKTNSSSYMSSFFQSENADLATTSTGLTFTSNSSNDMSFNFIRSVNAKQLLLEFVVDKEKIGCSSFTLNLSDSRNAEEKIALHFNFKYDALSGTDKLYCSLNDSTKEIVYNLGNENILSISYSNSSYIITDVLDSEVLTVDTYSNGESFNGFSSDEIYFDFTATGVTNGSFAMTMKTINNQGTNITRNDYQSPSINVNERIVSRVARGTAITIPTAYCYDVLNGINDLVVTVKYEDGEVLLQETNPTENLTCTLNKCGTYTITYSISDANGNVSESMYVVTVYDEVKPTLTFSSELPSSMKCGTSINLGNYTVSDDNVSTTSVYVYVYAPDGFMYEYTKGKYTFDQVGDYVVTYLVVDENDNSNLYVFHTTVK